MTEVPQNVRRVPSGNAFASVSSPRSRIRSQGALSNPAAPDQDPSFLASEVTAFYSCHETSTWPRVCPDSRISGRYAHQDLIQHSPGSGSSSRKASKCGSVAPAFLDNFEVTPGSRIVRLQLEQQSCQSLLVRQIRLRGRDPRSSVAVFDRLGQLPCVGSAFAFLLASLIS